MRNGFIRTVIAMLLLSLPLMGCAGQGKASGGGTIIGNPKFPVGPVAPQQEIPGNDQEKNKERDPTQGPAQEEEPPLPRTNSLLEFGGLVHLVLKSSKWILVPPGLPPSHGGLMRSPIKILVVLDDSLFLVEDED